MEGLVPVTGGRVWYQQVGANGRTPLVTLHGGPGVPHDYLESLAELGDERPVIFYDQLGCGKSDHPGDVSLWRVERFVEELEQLRQALGLARFHLLGQSWGTMLAMDYYLSHPAGIRSLVLASPVMSVPRYARRAAELRATLPAEVREVLDREEAAGRYDSDEYQAATMEFYKLYLCRLEPWPDCLMRSFAGMNPQIYMTMQGPTEFVITGNFKDWDRTPRLPEVRVPVLFTCGRYDEIGADLVAEDHRRTPGSRLAVFENSAHMAHLEEKEAYLAAVRKFLRESD